MIAKFAVLESLKKMIFSVVNTLAPTFIMFMIGSSLFFYKILDEIQIRPDPITVCRYYVLSVNTLAPSF